MIRSFIYAILMVSNLSLFSAQSPWLDPCEVEEVKLKDRGLSFTLRFTGDHIKQVFHLSPSLGRKIRFILNRASRENKLVRFDRTLLERYDTLRRKNIFSKKLKEIRSEDLCQIMPRFVNAIARPIEETLPMQPVVRAHPIIRVTGVVVSNAFLHHHSHYPVATASYPPNQLTVAKPL